MPSLLFSSRCATIPAQKSARKAALSSPLSKGIKAFTSVKSDSFCLRVSNAEATLLDEAYAELVDIEDETLEGEDVDLDEFEEVLAEIPEGDLLEQLAASQISASAPELAESLEKAKQKSIARAFAKTELGIPLEPLERSLIGDVVSEIALDGKEVIPEDVVPIKSFTRPDEEELRSLSPEEKEAVQPYKLTKAELKGLVPKNWGTLTIDWFANKKEDQVPLPTYRLTFLWLEKNIAVAVDQIYARGTTSPMTEYFFWPRKDAWEELRVALEARPWVGERDKIILLNRLTEVINFWQDPATKHTLEEARTEFPDCYFIAQS